MGMPNIPDINSNITVTNEKAINILLASIALEEIGLAHILNAEGEKIQTLVEMIEEYKASMEDIEGVQKSVSKLLKTVIKKDMLLQFKLEDIIRYIRQQPPIIIYRNIATVTATYDDQIYTDSNQAYYYTLAYE